MLTVACVLRSGGAYDEPYVHRLRQMVKMHLDLDYRFVCLTDRDDLGDLPHVEKLKHEWPGWWSKIELFRPGLFEGRVFYLDLDTSIVGSLDEIAIFGDPFGMVADWNHEWLGASGVMLWEATERHSQDIYGEFARDPEGAMEAHRGDQNWISGSVEWRDIRQRYPGQIVSRWYHCSDGVPENARIVCWHGTPKPARVDWSLEGEREHWREQVTDGG